MESIEDLIKEYQMENWSEDQLINAAMRYVKTMKDTQVKCLLYMLADMLQNRSI